MSIIFSKSDKRTQWEQAFNEAKQKLGSSFCYIKWQASQIIETTINFQFLLWKNIPYLNLYPAYQFEKPEQVSNLHALLRHWVAKKMYGCAIVMVMWDKYVFSVCFPNQRSSPATEYAMLEYYALRPFQQILNRKPCLLCSDPSHPTYYWNSNLAQVLPVS